jgi:hypothetical protein
VVELVVEVVVPAPVPVVVLVAPVVVLVLVVPWAPPAPPDPTRPLPPQDEARATTVEQRRASEEAQARDEAGRIEAPCRQAPAGGWEDPPSKLPD